MATCLFCNIAKGFEKTEMVFEDERFLAFDDLFPKADHHLLVIPRTHYENLDEFVRADGDSDEMLAFVYRVASQVGIAGGYRLMTNVGPEAGQAVPHLHWHLLAGTRVIGF